MSWFAQAKDLIAILVATLAVTLSLITAVLQTRQQQRQAYREIYDLLMSRDLHRGRWTIVDIRNETQIPKRGTEDYFLVYRTLGVFSALATYTRTGSSPNAWSSRSGATHCWTCTRAPRSSGMPRSGA
jgi:hypothetical protein